MSDEEFEGEPIPGLPQALPPGERLLWQGQPGWRSLARQAFHVRGLSLYFGAFIAARGVAALGEGQGPAGALWSGLGLVPLALACLGLLTALAWLNARATVYTITSRRVVMRFGVALPMTVNLPFKQLAAADLVARPEGDGDIALQVSGTGGLGYLPLWPHVRPWKVSPAQPMLRSIPEAKRISELLAQAVKDWAAAEAVRPQPQLTVISGGARPPVVNRTLAAQAER